MDRLCTSHGTVLSSPCGLFDGTCGECEAEASGVFDAVETGAVDFLPEPAACRLCGTEIPFDVLSGGCCADCNAEVPF